MVKPMETPTDQFQQIDDTGKVPSSRLTDVKVARKIVSKMVDNYAKRSKVHALVKGLVDGNPPFRQSDLDRNGQKYRSNFNTGESVAFLEVAKTSYYDLFSEVPRLATVVVSTGSEKDAEWSEIITEEFDRLQKKDKSLDFDIQLSHHDMVLYGSGPMVWEDDHDWRSHPVRFVDVYLPENSSSNHHNWSCLAIRYKYTSTRLYELIKDEETAAKVGWNVKATKLALLRATDKSLTQFDDRLWEDFQQKIRNNSFNEEEVDPDIEIFRLLYREFPAPDEEEGKISECWLTLKNTSTELDPDDFLFSRERVFGSWDQVVSPFFIDKGDGTAHSVKGIGVRMYKLLVTKMRLENATVDAAFARSAIMFQTSNAKSVKNASLVHLGPYTVLPKDLTLVPVNNTGGVLDAPMGVSKSLENTLSANLSQFRQRIDTQKGNPRTATEIEANLAQQSILGKTQIARYYSQADEWFSERFRRAFSPEVSENRPGGKLALEFQNRCRTRGVPVGIIPIDMIAVRATRAVGQGSAFLRSRTLKEMLATLGPSLPEAGRKTLLKDTIAAETGRHMVERYYPDGGELSPSEQEQKSEAMQENAMFKIGAPAFLTDLQDDYIHTVTHLEAMGLAAQSLQQGGKLIDVLTFLENAGVNVAGHLDRFKDDELRAPDVSAMIQQFNNFGKLADQLRKQIEQEQKQQAQQRARTQDAMTDAQIKTAKAEHDMMLKEAKAEQQMSMKEEQARQSMALKDATTAASINRSNTNGKQTEKKEGAK